ncbi:outer membrane murein-binding lipoprotein Lpp [Ereboglobus sp. PH5-5]|uniref:hypothetical protein n=1 Tax=Ereboglobus sp. PH5-5 TaxID=2940529 RepID=UPI002405AE44|nr:hypothetical protein [Ereboglobus sp. PH5-5]MDF9833929.1 outer membrane murein-binding lipoprotein Lpp [Ereboglobus sp. PH5-5]
MKNMNVTKVIFILSASLFLFGCQHKIKDDSGPLTVAELKGKIFRLNIPMGNIIDDRSAAWLEKNKLCLYYYACFGYAISGTGMVLPAETTLGNILARLPAGRASFIMSSACKVSIINYKRNYNIPIHHEEFENGSALLRYIVSGDIICVTFQP